MAGSKNWLCQFLNFSRRQINSKGKSIHKLLIIYAFALFRRVGIILVKHPGVAGLCLVDFQSVDFLINKCLPDSNDLILLLSGKLSVLGNPTG